MKRNLDKVAVLGAGVMGSRIACLFAGTGHRVLLLDIAHTSEDKNKLVVDAIHAAFTSNPKSLYDESFRERITVGTFNDDMHKIKECEWIIEAVTENLKIKKSLLKQVDTHRTKGTIVTSNTSGIPLRMMCEDLSEDFKQHFCGSHFFNPPRYVPLLEIIPIATTKPDVISFLTSYGFNRLGKEVILCKDTPGFIANRIGIYSMLATVKTGFDLDLSIGEIDDLTGKIIGRAKSATFRTADIVGIDTFVYVANNLYSMLLNDESRDMFTLPTVLTFLEDSKSLGDKNGKGFYKKDKVKGKSNILELNVKTNEYQMRTKANFPSFKQAKESGGDLNNKLNLLFNAKDKSGEFFRKMFSETFRYASMRMPDAAESIIDIDKAVKYGFNWELGIFETWDMLGFDHVLSIMETLSLKPGRWVYDMKGLGFNSFYKKKNDTAHYYDIKSCSYLPINKTIKTHESVFVLSDLTSNVIWKNESVSLYDLKDGVANLEFHSKMNSIGADTVYGLQYAIEIAERDFNALVIGNNSEHFSAGANLSIMYMYATQQEFEEIDLMIRQFQQMIMRIRYSSIPVIAATAGLALGGGCEVVMHCAGKIAHVETYIGLVETGVGLIPAGGGTKELAHLASERYFKGDVEINIVEKYFKQIALATVSTSAYDAVKLGYLHPNYITFNRQKLIYDAKKLALLLAEIYIKPQPPLIRVQGATGLAAIEASIVGMFTAGYISEYDAKIARKLAYVFCGGDLSRPQYVTEDYMLNLEREAFLSLTGEQKTQERIHSILFNRKPLRN